MIIYNPRFTARVHQSPCRDCSDRVVGCHDTCGQYADFKAKIAEEKEAVKAAYEPIRKTNDYVVKEAMKNKARARYKK